MSNVKKRYAMLQTLLDCNTFTVAVNH